MTAPAKSISSMFTRSFQAAHPSITFCFAVIKYSQTEERLGNDPVTICRAPLSNAICRRRVPFVVVSTSVLPFMNSLGYSNGEFPNSRPSAICPSRSPAVMLSICRPISMHFVTQSTGITHLAPLYKAVAIVEVALSTSMITTTLLLTSYKFKRGGERQVYSVGLLLLMQYNEMRKRNYRFRLGLI